MKTLTTCLLDRRKRGEVVIFFQKEIIRMCENLRDSFEKAIRENVNLRVEIKYTNILSCYTFIFI